MKKLLKKQLSLTLGALKNITGNARVCLLVEPLWGVSYNLFVPYASLYMLELGVDDVSIGLLASIGLALQVVFAFLGGYITDRLGRKRTSLIFDVLSWSVPTLVWAAARDFRYFLAAAVLNSLVRVVHTSWSCLLIEDTDPGIRVNVFTWLSVAGILAGFFSPIAGLFVKNFGLVPSVRGLYVFAFLAMTTMFFVRNYFTHETAVGVVKMKESKEHGIGELFAEYGSIIRGMLANRLLLVAFGLLVLNSTQIIIRSTFLSIVLTRGVGLSRESVSMFPALSSAVVMFIYIFVMPSIRTGNFHAPLMLGILASFASNFLLFVSPTESYAIVTLATLVGAVGTAFVQPFVDTMVANTVEDAHRAKILSIMYTLQFAVSTPFGYIGGVLSKLGPRLPAVMLMGLFILCLLLVLAEMGFRKRARPEPAR